jgi:PhnB protein
MGRMTTLRPRLVVRGAAEAIDYYRDVFGAEEIVRYTDPTGKIVHAELAVGSSRLTLKDEDATDRAPDSRSGSPVLLMLDVEGVDAVAERMVAGGGTVIFPIGDSEAGRGGRVRDPFGHSWMISEPT